MNKRMNSIVNGIAAVTGILSIGAGKIWATACEGMLTLEGGSMMPMKCTYTCKAGIFLGIILLILAVENLAKNQVTGLAYFAVGILMLFLPAENIGIGICAKEGMACADTATWLRITGISACVCGVWALLIKGKKNL